MDYEQKYKEALEKAREQYNKRIPLYDIESIFPELKKSKDEIMREDLYKCLRCYVPNDKAEEFIAWLEKQKGD